jgi:pimeloyl-ACP methyl ester carboxylesterase
VVGLASVLLAAGLAAATPARADTLPQPCRVPGVAQELRCGSVTRALDPARPDGTRIEVHYLLVPAMARRKLPDPVLMLAGGPGQSAIALAPSVLLLLGRLNNRRDLVFIDQRGTGRSAPLQCDEPADEPITSQADPLRERTRMAACRQGLLALPHVQGADGLRHYTTTVAMQDVDAVRRQLGAARWNVIGGSYGTRAALELQRQFPGTVRRMVLDGVAPPDMALPLSMSADTQAVLDALFAACAQTSDCQRAYPRLREDWATLLASLPREVSLVEPRSGRREQFRLGRDMLLNALRGPMYVPALAAALPRAITEAAAGRFEPLAGLNAMIAPRPDRRPGQALATGMHFSVVCAEDLPRLAASPDQPGRDFGNASRRLYEDVCADWPRGEVPAAFYRINPSPAPVLLLSGGLDPVTPPRHGARVAAALGPLASHRVVPHAGHGVMPIGCVRDVIWRFIDADNNAGALAVDSRCVEAIPRPPAFIVAGEVGR